MLSPPSCCAYEILVPEREINIALALALSYSVNLSVAPHPHHIRLTADIDDLAKEPLRYFAGQSKMLIRRWTMRNYKNAKINKCIKNISKKKLMYRPYNRRKAKGHINTL